MDNQLYSPITNRILLRCETNIFKLYRGVAETELHVAPNHYSLMTQNYDHRYNGRGDPDNSPLTGASSKHLNHTSYSLFLTFSTILIFLSCCW